MTNVKQDQDRPVVVEVLNIQKVLAKGIPRDQKVEEDLRLINIKKL